MNSFTSISVVAGAALVFLAIARGLGPSTEVPNTRSAQAGNTPGPCTSTGRHHLANESQGRDRFR